MKLNRKILAVLAVLGALVMMPALASEDDFEVKKLAIQISDNDPKTMTKVLNVALLSRKPNKKPKVY